jgi:Cwf15/Cwc15 cell cycle control protein
MVAATTFSFPVGSLTRQAGQATSSELKSRDLKAELLAKERQHFENVRKEKSKATGTLIDAAPLQLTDATAAAAVKSEERVTKPLAAPAESSVNEDAEDILAQFDDADDNSSSECVPESVAGIHLIHVGVYGV